MKYKYIDLFSGCGGLEEGFLQSEQFEGVASVEWLKPQVDTLKNRLKKKWKITNSEDRVLHFDLQREDELFHGWNNDEVYGSHKGLDSLVKEAGGIDIVIGGPPCQAYSIAGRVRDEKGMRSDYRNYLFEHYLSVLKRYQPKVFLFENVPGILSSKPGDRLVTELIREGFDDIGYEIVNDLKGHSVINAKEYGVPQARKRVFIIGVRKEDTQKNIQELLRSFYLEILPKYKVENEVSVKEAIGDLPKYEPIYNEGAHKKRMVYKLQKGEKENTITWHKPRYHNVRDMGIYKLLAEDLESGQHKYLDSKALSELYKELVGSHSPIHRYHVLKPDFPSTTIIAHLYKDGNRFIHYDSSQARTITPREAARLQSFDDDYEFIGGQGAVFQMIGNAVPPLLSKNLAFALSKLLKQI